MSSIPMDDYDIDGFTGNQKFLPSNWYRLRLWNWRLVSIVLIGIAIGEIISFVTKFANIYQYPGQCCKAEPMFFPKLAVKGNLHSFV